MAANNVEWFTGNLNQNRNDSDSFIVSIDPGLLEYKEELYKHAVKSETTLRFLRPREVQLMDIPSVYKRMLIEKIINLQTPDTKLKLKEEGVSPDSKETGGGNFQPKRLKFGNENQDVLAYNVAVTPENKSEKSLGVMQEQIAKLEEERACFSLVLVQKKDELQQLKSSPKQPDPLPIPGIPINKFICDNCHHRGHKAFQNKNKKSCPYMKCEGYHYCGVDTKHKEFKSQVTEAEREVAKFEKKIKGINEEIANMKSFLNHNMSSFVTSLKPALKAANPYKYKGKDGTQELQKDLRLIKIATEGKIPKNLDRDNILRFVEAGRAKVNVTCGTFDDFDDKSCDIDDICKNAIPNNCKETGKSVKCTAVDNSPVTQSNYSVVDVFSPSLCPSNVTIPQSYMLPCAYPQYQYFSMANTTPFINTQSSNYSTQNFPNLWYSPYLPPASGRQPSATVTSQYGYKGNIQESPFSPPLPEELPPPLPPMPKDD